LLRVIDSHIKLYNFESYSNEFERGERREERGERREVR
jgi:hypothetical protein